MTAEAEEAHPPASRWYVEIKDGDWQRVGSAHADRSILAEQLAERRANRPLWADGTPVRYRLVRETTTYTVEPA